MAKTISRDVPLAEITLRRYERPANLSKRDLLRKLCLSLGLLQPGDSRDVIVDILHTTLQASKKRNHLTLPEIEQRVINSRKQLKLPLVGVTPPNLTRQIRRLKELSILEKAPRGYRIVEFSKVRDLFEEKIQNILVPSINTRITEYLNKIDDEFSSV
jgi:hypothetical protein|tara:strand:- start:843 stop:1316 length:474 start_codon:yes stop_codon:yes gene_type:complete